MRSEKARAHEVVVHSAKDQNKSKLPGLEINFFVREPAGD